jgi:hypothetical protein
VERTLLSAAVDFDLDANREKCDSPAAKQSFEKARLQAAPQSPAKMEPGFSRPVFRLLLFPYILKVQYVMTSRAHKDAPREAILHLRSLMRLVAGETKWLSSQRKAKGEK